MAGRKRTPDSIKEAKGTAQKSRINPNPPKPKLGMPKAPNWLNDEAKSIFRSVAGYLDEMQLAFPAHVKMLSILAMRLEQVQHFSTYLDNNGNTYESVNPKTGQTMVRAQPEVSLLSEAARHAQSLLAEFGLSPASMGKIQIPTSRGNDPWEDFE